MIARRAARARVETRAPTRSMVGAAHRFCRSLDAVFLRLWDLSFWLCSLFKDPQFGLGLDNSWVRAEWARREPCRGAVEGSRRVGIRRGSRDLFKRSGPPAVGTGEVEANTL